MSFISPNITLYALQRGTASLTEHYVAYALAKRAQWRGWFSQSKPELQKIPLNCTTGSSSYCVANTRMHRRSVHETARWST